MIGYRESMEGYRERARKLADLLERARKLADLLPGIFVEPEISDWDEDDGDPETCTDLEWYPMKGYVVSVGVYPLSDKLAVAWLRGKESGHAVIPFDGFTFPSELSDILRHVGLQKDPWGQ